MALVLGKTVGEVQRQISPRELGYWMAYFNIEPFGPLQESLRAGTLAATIANTTPGIKQRFAPADFFAELEVGERKLDDDEEDEDAAIAREEREMAIVRAAVRSGARGQDGVK